MKSKSRGGWPDWIESEEGKRSADISTLPPGPKGATYLENRLWAAFVAGAKFERESRVITMSYPKK
jgi:hypothetical protein